MKRRWSFLMMVVLGCVGCVSYRVESQPQGLRVTVNELEEGTTPCRVSRWTWGNPIRTKITVYPPKSPKVAQYEREKGVVVTSWKRGEMSKTLFSEHGSGRVLFDFIQDEDMVPGK